MEHVEKNPPLIKRGVGVSLVWRKKLSDRLHLANLKPFLTTVGWIANYEFDDNDWQEVQTLLASSKFNDDQWCEYEMVGTHSARLKLAIEDNEFVCLEANVPAELLPQLRLAIEIFTQFQVSA